MLSKKNSKHPGKQPQAKAAGNKAGPKAIFLFSMSAVFEVLRKGVNTFFEHL
jgi:hypothetical protein